MNPEFKQVQHSVIASQKLCPVGGVGNPYVYRTQQGMVSRRERAVGAAGGGRRAVCLWEALDAVPALRKERDGLCNLRPDGPRLANKEVGVSWLRQPD